MNRELVAFLFCCIFLCFSGCKNKEAPDTAGRQTRLPSEPADEFDEQRRSMVERQIRARGVRDTAVLAAMIKVPRHLFVPEDQRPLAAADHPLPIGYGQTISQPFIVAYMTEAVEASPHEKVLEIGTGSGYQAAVLGELVKEVYTVEIIPELAERARQTLSTLGYLNVHVKTGNGYEGWGEHAPFDGIVVTAAPDHVPQALVDQLAINGKMVIPVGVGDQEMLIITRTRDGVVEKRTIPVRFVPMTGKPLR
jgi:protein-L-isoaspartate(D-aspartate) O-methyltransferase